TLRMRTVSASTCRAHPVLRSNQSRSWPACSRTSRKSESSPAARRRGRRRRARAARRSRAWSRSCKALPTKVISSGHVDDVYQVVGAAEGTLGGTDDGGAPALDGGEVDFHGPVVAGRHGLGGSVPPAGQGVAEQLQEQAEGHGVEFAQFGQAHGAVGGESGPGRGGLLCLFAGQFGQVAAFLAAVDDLAGAAASFVAAGAAQARADGQGVAFGPRGARWDRILVTGVEGGGVHGQVTGGVQAEG